MEKKVTIVGAGHVGATAAITLALKDIADIVLIDIVEGTPQGKALDMMQMAPICNFNSKITGTNDYKDTANSDVVVVTAGLPRKPGMSRDDLLSVNAKITESVTNEIVKYSPNCILIVVTNPLDVMVNLAMEFSGFPKNRLIGMAGVLDSARYRTFLAEELDASPGDVQGMVLGIHGDKMLPIPRFTTVNGIPITELLPKEKIDEIGERTKVGGGEIVKLLKTGSAYYAPGISITVMVEAILKDLKKKLPCAVYLEGEYGISGVFLGVPVILGKNGVEKIIELNLTEEELEALKDSAASVKDNMDAMHKINMSER
ncbi:MAG: malate dehydrogenase [Nitrospinae bacterium]|nr:malate dehydrogenase [Nitrospinota bacterium]